MSPRTRTALSLSLVFLFLVAAPIALAQPVITPYLTMEVQCDGENPRAVVEVGITETTDSAIVGFDVYRVSMGGECESIRITDEPLMRGLPGHHLYNVPDTVDASSTIYQYVVHPVNAARENIPFTDSGPEFPYVLRVGWSRCNPGAAYIGTGTIISGPGFPPYFFQACPGDCQGFFNLLPDAETAAFADTDQARQFYGRFAGCGIEGCDFMVEFSVAASCAVSAPPTSWGALKARY